MRIMSVLSSAILSMAIAMAAQAQNQTVDAGETIYKWTDAQGVEHYGATPPAGVEAEKVDLDDSQVSTVETQPATSVEEAPQGESPEEEDTAEQASGDQTATVDVTVKEGEDKDMTRLTSEEVTPEAVQERQQGSENEIKIETQSN